MLYLANPSTPRVREAMTDGTLNLGTIRTPKQGNRHLPGVPWCADNGCFGKGYPGDEAWLRWLDSLPRDDCLFAVAPDVVGDAAATLRRSSPFLQPIRDLGFPAALVAQNRIEDLWIPWAAFDVLFLGGVPECVPCRYIRPVGERHKKCACGRPLTEWKLGAAARELARHAKALGKRVHMGRVNSADRYTYAAAIGCDSADGTFITFAPDLNLERFAAWTATDRQLDLTWFA